MCEHLLQIYCVDRTQQCPAKFWLSCSILHLASFDNRSPPDTQQWILAQFNQVRTDDTLAADLTPYLHRSGSGCVHMWVHQSHCSRFRNTICRSIYSVCISSNRKNKQSNEYQILQHSKYKLWPHPQILFLNHDNNNDNYHFMFLSLSNWRLTTYH